MNRPGGVTTSGTFFTTLRTHPVRGSCGGELRAGFPRAAIGIAVVLPQAIRRLFQIPARRRAIAQGPLLYANGQLGEGRAFVYLGAPDAATAAGRVPDGATGTPLRAAKAASNQITLTWGASCLLTDGDYEIYEGTIGGSFTSHTSLFCSTSGATTKTFLPSSANSYYLVVPMNGVREGSYGKSSTGVERPRGTSACLPQQIGTCP